MKFYHRVGLVMALFSLCSLVGNLLTPGNEHHYVNIFEQGVLVGAFGMSAVLPVSIGSWAQIGALFGAALVAALTGSLGAAGALGAGAVILTYVYGAFQTLPLRVVVGVGVVQGLTAFLAAMVEHRTLLGSFVAALLWTIFPLVGVWLLWSVLQEFAEKVVAQNRELLEINKNLMRGGKDAPERS